MSEPAVLRELTDGGILVLTLNRPERMNALSAEISAGILDGVRETKSELDSIIEKFSSNWKITRMSCVDRNIMRIAVYELLYCNDIPAKVSINEAIDVGKKFGTDESGAFINGILDSIRTAIDNGEIKIK